MARMYTLDKKLLTGVPEIRIGDDIITVDDREKTVKKALKLMNDDNVDDVEKFDKILKLTLSPKDYKKIDEMNMPWAAYQELVMIVISALTGEDPEVVEERFQESASTKQ